MITNVAPGVGAYAGVSSGLPRSHPRHGAGLFLEVRNMEGRSDATKATRPAVFLYASRPVQPPHSGLRQCPWRRGARGALQRVARIPTTTRSEEHTSELPVTNAHIVCRLLLEKKKKNKAIRRSD